VATTLAPGAESLDVKHLSETDERLRQHALSVEAAITPSGAMASGASWLMNATFVDTIRPRMRSSAPSSAAAFASSSVS
jgi:hypothetical protein